MQVELSTWRPLWDFAAVLFVLGAAGCMSNRERTAWWVSQGLLLLSVLVGLAAASVTHSGVDLLALGIWVPVAWGLSACTAIRYRRAKQQSKIAATSRSES